MTLASLPPHVHRPVARPDVELAWFDSEAVLFDPVARQLHSLAGAAAAVYVCCDGTQDVHEMTAELAEMFSVAADDIAPDVVRALQQFDNQGLLVGSPTPLAVVEVPHDGADGVDRDVLPPPPYG